MAKIDNKNLNTELMRQHQLKKGSTSKTTHDELDLGIGADVIDYSQSIILNSHEEHAKIASILQANPEDKTAVSDIDAEMLIKIRFKQPVCINYITLRADKAPDNIDSSPPSIIYAFSNTEDLDFEDAESQKNSAYKITVEENDVINLKKFLFPGNKFQKVTSVQLFVSSNQKDTEHTFLNRLSLNGYLHQV